MSVRFVCALAGLAVLIAGCPADEPPPPPFAHLQIEGPDPERPQWMDFGGTVVGSSDSLVLTLNNLSEEPLRLLDLTLNDTTNYATSHDGGLAGRIPALGSIRLTVTFTPLTPGTHGANVAVLTDDRAHPLLRVVLNGEGLAPELAVAPESITLGDVAIGCTGEETILLTNEGEAPLTLDDVSLVSTEESSELWLAGVVPAGTAIDPGESLALSARYSPRDAGSDAATLVVASDSFAAPETLVAVQGGARVPQDHVDTFGLEPNDALDVLVVRHQGLVPASTQVAIDGNLAVMFAELVASDLDWRLGMVSMDASDQGQLFGMPPIITPASADPAAEFAARLQVMNEGIPRAMESMALALATGGPNPDFLRPDALLHVVIVGNSGDFSPGLATGYAQDLQSIKSSADLVRVSTAGGGLTGCSGSGLTAPSSVDWVQLSVLTGGSSYSICDDDWSLALGANAWAPSPPPTVFSLTAPALEESIEVWAVQGASPGWPLGGWTYDSVQNTVTFLASSVPDGGVSLEVSYLENECDG